MIIRSIPATPRALIFDMDGTLYTNEPYIRWQQESQIRRFAAYLSIGEEEARARLAGARRRREEAGLPKTSLAELFVSLGIKLTTIIQWREEEFSPAAWLRPDPGLKAALDALASSYTLLLLTNNPRKVGLESLEALGVGACFEAVVGLDDSGVSKPSAVPFRKACGALRRRPSECISIGDRMDIDIEPALALGMGGILVDGVADVVALPRTFLSARSP